MLFLRILYHCYSISPEGATSTLQGEALGKAAITTFLLIIHNHKTYTS